MDNKASLGSDVSIQGNAIVGYAYSPDCGGAVIGNNSVIRSGSMIYGDVQTGDHFQTGHNVIVREKCSFGRFVLVGSGTVIDGQLEVGDYVKIIANCYIPTHVRIGTRVFIGPNVVLTNDRYPLKDRDHYRPEGPIIEDFVTLGGGTVVVPGVTVGEGSFVAAGAVVTKDVPPYTLVKGSPGRFYDLPEKLCQKNVALNWRKFINDEI